MKRLCATVVAMLACNCAMAANESEYRKEYREASALAAAGKGEGVTRLFELRRRADSAERAESIVVDLYYYLHRTPEVWVRALAKQDPNFMKAFLKSAGLGYEVPNDCQSRDVCSTEIIARLAKFKGSKSEEALAAEVIATLSRTMKG